MGSHTEVQFPRLPRGGYSVVGDKNRQKLVLIRSVWPDRDQDACIYIMLFFVGCTVCTVSNKLLRTFQ